MLCVHWVQEPSATFSVNQTFTCISDTKWPFSVTDNKCERRTTLAEILESTVHWHKSPSSNIHRLSNSPLGTLHMNARRLLLNRLSASVLFFFSNTKKRPLWCFHRCNTIGCIGFIPLLWTSVCSSIMTSVLDGSTLPVHKGLMHLHATNVYVCTREIGRYIAIPFMFLFLFFFCIHVLPNPPRYEAHVLMYELF